MAPRRSQFHRLTATPVQRKPSVDFSITGLVYVCMMMFLGLAAINSQANLLFGVFGLMIGVLMISWSISRLVLRRLRVRRILPEGMVVGEHATFSYEFTNEKRFWPSLSVSLGEIDGCDAFTRQPFTYMLHAAAGMTAVVPTEVIPKRRGLHVLDRYQISTSFPFGFIKRAMDFHLRETALVYPALAHVDPQILMLCQSAEKSGATMRPRRGGMDEFYGVKEYRQGENPRWIYWRRSARTGTLVVREMTQVAPPRLMLLVDTCLRERTLAEQTDGERTIAMAASLASHALESGLSVGLCAWAEGWVSLPPNRGKRQRRDILSLLSRLPVNTQYDADALVAQGQSLITTGTTPVLLTARDVQWGLGEHLRGGLVVISASMPEAERWFQFRSEVDFAQCMPPDQEPLVPSRPRRFWPWRGRSR